MFFMLKAINLKQLKLLAQKRKNKSGKRLPTIAAVTKDIDRAGQRRSIVLYHWNRPRFI